ncbi:TraG/TraD/VirD4 family protein, partial [Streptomyces sparsogenes]
ASGVAAAAPQPVPTPRGGPGFPGAEAPAHSRVLYGTQRGDAASQAVLDAVGPVLVVTSDAALWAGTKDARAKFGPTHVFDPSHLLDTPARLRWNPAAGCESRDVAATRAAALLAPVRPLHAVDRPMAEAAETMLRCWLHAAAVDGRPFRHVHRWAQGNSAHEPVRILRTHAKAAGGAAGELEATLTAHPERRDMAQELTARALAALSSIHIRDACNPGRSDALALESFVGEGGTLYVMGESIEDPRTHPGAMPLLTALASHVVEHGRRMAERSSSGRLDPPLTLVLDDVAAVAPLPQLPDLLAHGASLGLPTLALMRSQEQARARWPHRTLVG